MTIPNRKSAAAPSEIGVTTKHILVCDDDVEILNIIVQTLELNPRYTTTSCGTTKAVMDYLQSDAQKPDLLILDLWLPDKDSDDSIPEIRQIPVIQDIPIMLISAIVNIEVLARELKVEGWLSKPFTLDELEGRVGDLLGE